VIKPLFTRSIKEQEHTAIIVVKKERTN